MDLINRLLILPVFFACLLFAVGTDTIKYMNSHHIVAFGVTFTDKQFSVRCIDFVNNFQWNSEWIFESTQFR